MPFDFATFDFQKVLEYYAPFTGIKGLQVHDDLEKIFGVMKWEDRYKIIEILRDLGLIMIWGGSSWSSSSSSDKGTTKGYQNPGPPVWSPSRLSMRKRP